MWPDTLDLVPVIPLLPERCACIGQWNQWHHCHQRNQRNQFHLSPSNVKRPRIRTTHLAGCLHPYITLCREYLERICYDLSRQRAKRIGVVDAIDYADYSDDVDWIPPKTKEQGLFSLTPRSFVSSGIIVTLSGSSVVALFRFHHSQHNHEI